MKTLYTKKDILAQSFVSLALLVELSIACSTNNAITLKEFINNFESSTGIAAKKNQNVIFTPAAVLGVMYIACVNSVNEYKNILQNKKMQDIKLTNLSEISYLKGNQDLYNLVKNIRNAISHNDYQVTKDFMFEFNHSYKEEKKIQAKIALEDMRDILHRLALTLQKVDL